MITIAAFKQACEAFVANKVLVQGCYGIKGAANAIKAFAYGTA